MTLWFDIRILGLTGVVVALAACSDVTVQHVAEPAHLQVLPERVTLYLAADQGDEDRFPSTVRLTAQVRDLAGSLLEGNAAELRWESLASEVASVDMAGRVAAKATGSAMVRVTTVSKPAIQATVSVTVEDAGSADVVVK